MISVSTGMVAVFGLLFTLIGAVLAAGVAYGTIKSSNEAHNKQIEWQSKQIESLVATIAVLDKKLVAIEAVSKFVNGGIHRGDS